MIPRGGAALLINNWGRGSNSNIGRYKKKNNFKNLLKKHSAKKAETCVKAHVVQNKVCTNHDSMEKSGDINGEGRLNISEKNLLLKNKTTKGGFIFTVEMLNT